MIPFFRKIRKKLADDNQFLKYSRYAIGEIVLVVIGILIALQINNWNENIKANKLGKAYLVNLKSDLIVQKNIINKQIRFEKNVIMKLDSCSLLIDPIINVDELSKQLESLSGRLTFIANKVTFMNMGFNRNEIVIQNSNLFNSIVSYYQQLDYTTSVINNNNLFRINSQFGTFVVNNSLGFRIDKNGEPDSAYNLDPEKRFTLKSQLDERRRASLNNLNKCNLQLENTEKIIQLINNELNN